MTRRLVALSLFASFAFTVPAFADESREPKQERTVSATSRYANTAERWRGAPSLRRLATTHPVDGATASEKVYESVPSANFLVEGRNAFPIATGF